MQQAIVNKQVRPLGILRSLRVLRVLVKRFMHRELRKESPVLDRFAPSVEDRTGYGPIQLR